jgi:hypothetical protein
VFGPRQIQSPSGHVAAASVVVGGLTALLTGRRALSLGAAVVAAILIGATRLRLGAHSVPEVLIGSVLGIAGAAVIAHFAGPSQVRRPLMLLVMILFVALLLHGFHLSAEAAIRHGAYHSLDFVPACRADEALPWPPSEPGVSASP